MIRKMQFFLFEKMFWKGTNGNEIILELILSPENIKLEFVPDVTFKIVVFRLQQPQYLGALVSYFSRASANVTNTT